MRNNWKFSIIVPVYNVEAYIDECLLSLINQTYPNLEIVIVDDGSNDNCPCICDIYAKKDNRISVIHQPNRGLSSARNTGILHSTGDYVVFVDSDDLLDVCAIDRLNKAAINFPDVIVTELFNTIDVSKKPNEDILFCQPSLNDKASVIEFVFGLKKNVWPAPQYIVKRNLISDNSLTFEIGRYHEDVSWTTLLFSKAQTFAFYSGVWYIRRLARAGSIMNTMNSKRTIDMLEQTISLFESGVLSNLSPMEKAIIEQQLAEAVIWSLNSFPFYSSDDKKEICRLLDKNLPLLKSAKILYQKIFVRVLCCFGSKTTMNFISTALKIKNRKR